VQCLHILHTTVVSGTCKNSIFGGLSGLHWVTWQCGCSCITSQDMGCFWLVAAAVVCLVVVRRGVWLGSSARSVLVRKLGFELLY
jgi:hypothetical protein